VRTGFRHADSRYPFLWEDSSQPAARWHADGEGPAQYLAETSDGAWAEFVRHEEITDAADLAGVARSMWSVELPADIDTAERLDPPFARGGVETYPACQKLAAAHRAAGATMLSVPSAAVVHGGARGQVTDGGLREASDLPARNWVLFGAHPNLRGWRVVEGGAPPSRVLTLARLPGA